MPRILVIDDSTGMRLLLKRILTSAGYEVQEAADGQVAVDLYAERPSDLVITDIVMPGKEGLETIMELRRRNPKVRIIAISGGGSGGYGVGEYLKTARLLGASGVLAKPFTPEQVLKAVAEALGEGPLGLAQRPTR